MRRWRTGLGPEREGGPPTGSSAPSREPLEISSETTAGRPRREAQSLRGERVERAPRRCAIQVRRGEKVRAVSAMQAEVAIETKVLHRCGHVSTRCLGSGGSATYRQCRSCGAVLMVYGGRIFAIRPERPSAKVMPDVESEPSRERRGGALYKYPRRRR